MAILKWKLIDRDNLPKGNYLVIDNFNNPVFGSSALIKNFPKIKHYMPISELLKIDKEEKSDNCIGCYYYHNGECIEDNCIDNPFKLKKC